MGLFMGACENFLETFHGLNPEQTNEIL